MLAAQLVGPGQFDVIDAPMPDIGRDQVLVRMDVASICGSDLHATYGPFQPERFPAAAGYPGHEGVGVVVDSRSAAFAAGDVVLTVPHLGRMTCFAHYHLAEASFLIRLPSDGDRQKVLMAQQLGTVVFALRNFLRVTASKADSVTVIGAGSSGLFFLQLLRRAGFQNVIVSDPIAARRALAMTLGAVRVVDPVQESVEAVTRELTGGLGSELVIEAAGTTASRVDAVASAAPGGHLGLFGYPSRPGTEEFPVADVWRKALTIVASANTQLEPGLRSFRAAVDLISSGSIDVSHLLGDQAFDLTDIQSAFNQARSRQSSKVRLDLSGVSA